MAKENESAKVQRVFNVAEYAEKARKALKRLKSEQKAGQVITGGKTDVLAAIKDELKDLADSGYTVQQIADALKDDVFSILPKSITTAIHGKKKQVKRTTKNTNTVDSLGEQPANKETATSTNGGFVVKPDRT